VTRTVVMSVESVYEGLDTRFVEMSDITRCLP
jgi:hypothetical protein